MKVLHVINSLSMGGAEKLIAETLPLIRRQGVDVELLLLNSDETPLLNQVRASGITVHQLGHGSVYSPLHIFKIMPLLKTFDIAHVHLFPAQYFVAAAKILSRSKTRLFFTEHNTTNRRIQKPYFKIPEKIIYAQFEKVICITDEVKQVLMRHVGLPEDKLRVVENGIDTGFVNAAIPLKKSEIAPSLNSSDKLILQVSGFRPQKDQETLIKAMTRLPQDYILLLAGVGETKARHEQLVKELELESRVHFLGIRNDIPQLLKTVDVAVLSSHYEGLSLASLEAMASGTPFIGSDVPGIRDLVDSHGILFPEGDARQLASEIEKLLTNPTYYSSVSECCVARAKAFDIRTMVRKTVQLYESILT